MRNADFDVAKAQLEKIQKGGLDKLSFMWMGPTDGVENIFYQIYEPAILINFVNQHTGFDWNTLPHIIIVLPIVGGGDDYLRWVSEQCG